MWHKTTRSFMGGQIYRKFTPDGTYLVGSSPHEIEEGPRVEGEYWFKGNRIAVMDVRAIPGYGMCVEDDQIGTYRVEILDGGNIRFVLVEDPCTARARRLGSGEMEPVTRRQ
jgi:hypothetical protein